KRRILWIARKGMVDDLHERSGCEIDDQNDDARANEEPRALLEGLPAEADERSGRQFHAPTISEAASFVWQDSLGAVRLSPRNESGRPTSTARVISSSRQALAIVDTKPSRGDFHLAMPIFLS